MKAALCLILASFLLGLSLAIDEDYIRHNLRNLIILRSQDANRTYYSFDIGKSNLKDDYKSLAGQIPSYILNIGQTLDFNFYLAKCASFGADKTLRRGRVTVAGKTYPLSQQCPSCGSMPFYDPFRPTGANIHQKSASLHPNVNQRPVGVEINFDRLNGVIPKRQSYNSTYITNYDLVTKLRVMCLTNPMQENQIIPQGQYYQDVSVSGNTVYVTFSHWSAAGCAVPVPKADLDDIETLIAILFSFIFLAFVGAAMCFNLLLVVFPLSIVVLALCCGCCCIVFAICGCCCLFLCCCCCCCLPPHHCCRQQQQQPRTEEQVVLTSAPAINSIQPVQYVMQPATVVPVQQPQEKKEVPKVQQVSAVPMEIPQQQFIEMQPVQFIPQQQVQQPVYAFYPPVNAAGIMQFNYPSQ